MIDLMQEPALDLVITALERIRDGTGRTPCASRIALAQLLETLPIAPSIASAPAAVSSSKHDLLAPIRERALELAATPSTVTQVLADGAATARAQASETMAKVRDKMGFLPEGG